jgi:hypothetical protein
MGHLKRRGIPQFGDSLRNDGVFCYLKKMIGYDQWQITANGGQVPIGSTGMTMPASLLPYYSVHAVDGQLNYILSAKNFSLFFKSYHEFSASSHTIGNTIVFGGAWTLLIPKPKTSTGSEVVSRDEVCEQRKGHP